MSTPAQAVFLSYASQDAEPVRRICDALRARGVEVWFDADGGLEHGDEWDAKIRRQIKECVLFMPIISANTQAREEGYFRIEWELAAERAMGFAHGVAFLLPVVIDDTRESDALVPDRFRRVQWTRIPDGRVTPEMQARLLKVWSHRTGVLANEAARASSPPAQPMPTSTATRRKSRAMIYALVAALMAAVTAGLVWSKRQSPAGGDATAKTERAQSSGETGLRAPAIEGPTKAAQPSSARELAEKARELFTALESTREDFGLAEEFCQQAIKLDPTDGDVWAIYADLNSAFVYRGWEPTPERKERCRSMAQRAIRLSPSSWRARLSQASAWSTMGINRRETESLLRELVQERPGEQGALRFLAGILIGRGGLEEALALNERSAALPGGDPLALFNSARNLYQRYRPAEAYATLQRALAQKPFTSALVLKIVMDISWRGDLAAAEAALKRIPQAELLEDRANYFAGHVAFCQRHAQEALRTWGAFPREFYADFVFDGPKGTLLGLAHELDHHDDAARSEWQAALRAVDKRLAAASNSAILHFHRSFLLACLGDKAAAEDELRTYLQLAGVKVNAESPMLPSLAHLYLRLGRTEEVIANLPASLSQASETGMWPARLRLDPRFDALRKDPRFEKLLAQYPLPESDRKQ